MLPDKDSDFGGLPLVIDWFCKLGKVIWFPYVTQFSQIKIGIGTSLVVQWLRFHASNAGDAGSNPDGEIKILHAAVQYG